MSKNRQWWNGISERSKSIYVNVRLIFEYKIFNVFDVLAYTSSDLVSLIQAWTLLLWGTRHKLWFPQWSWHPLESSHQGQPETMMKIFVLQDHFVVKHNLQIHYTILISICFNSVLNFLTFSTSPLCTKSTLIVCSFRMLNSLSISTNTASEACRDMSLARASDVLPCKIYQ